jgi:hypothetical protein
MSMSKRLYLVAGLVALLAIAFSAVTLASRLTSAQEPSPTPSVQTSDLQDEADDAAEGAVKGPDTDAIEEQVGPEDEADDAAEGAVKGPDTDAIEEQVGPQDEVGDVGEETALAGQIDDGADLLPQASVTLDQAIAAAQSAASGDVGEVDLEHYQGKLVFNVDVGDKDVKVDAMDGSIVAVDADD